MAQVDWAVAHSHELQAYIEQWRSNPDADKDVVLGGYYNAKCHRIDVYIREIAPLPLEWGLSLGDVAHNYRCCLDHAAWALVWRGHNPPPTLNNRARRKIFFPIWETRTQFNNELPKMLPGVRRSDAAVVRAFQPYLSGKRRAANHAFAILQRLSNDDKHRSVQPAQSAPRGFLYEVGAPVDCEITRIASSHVMWEPLQNGTHLVPIYVRRTGPNPDIQLKASLTAQPALQQGVWLGGWLDVMPRLVATLLGGLSDPPTELLAKLGGPVP